MKDKEFNLVEEPWIKVLCPNNSSRELSLKDALIYAHEYTDLGGENVLQNVTILRLMLAVLHTVFYNMDTEGKELPIKNIDDAYSRWDQLWDVERFPEKPITEYLEKWKERFWLFHPEQPFFPAPEEKSPKFKIPNSEIYKLIGDISESDNKPRVFSSRSGAGKESLSYAEGARWLLFLNGFHDTSLKKPTPKVGWLGRCSIIYATGSNLFETLLLNMVMVQDGKIWKAPMPFWETETDFWEQKTWEEKRGWMVWPPDNQAELLTMPFRRMQLKRENGRITGFSIRGGVYFDRENVYTEQMTAWEKEKDGGFKPRRCKDASRQMWRDFASDFLSSDDCTHRQPGIVTWIYNLKNGAKVLEKKKIIEFRCAFALYNDGGIPYAAICDISTDSLAFHTSLLKEAGTRWQQRISEEIKKIDKMANCVEKLSEDLSYAAGLSENPSGQSAKEQLYYMVDIPLRKWLLSIDPLDELADGEKLVQDWHDEARKIGLTLGDKMVKAAGPVALKGRYFKPKQKPERKYYSSAGAQNKFHANIYNLYQLYPKEEKDQ